MYKIPSAGRGIQPTKDLSGRSILSVRYMGMTHGQTIDRLGHYFQSDLNYCCLAFIMHKLEISLEYSISNKIVYAPNEESDQHVYLCSLIRDLVWHSVGRQGFKVSSLGAHAAL